MHPARQSVFRLVLQSGSIMAGATLLWSSAALAAQGKESGPSEALFVAQIVLLLLLGRLLGEAMQRIGQPAVMGQLLAGILLGPSVFGLLWPAAQHAIFPPDREQKSMIDAVSQLGILMLLLLTGMGTDLKLVRKVGRAAIGVSIAGIAVPFACGFALGEFLPDSMLARPEQRLVTSLFLGTALAISSVKIVAMVVREMNFLRRNVGQIIVASAIIDDTIGWVIVAIIFGLAEHGTVDAVGLGRSVIGIALFLILSFTLGRRLVFALIRWTNDRFVSEAPVITAILVVMGVMALITDLIGVHTVLGAFVAGILVGESPILTHRIDEQLRGLITGLFMPVFFGLSGLSADLTILRDPFLVLVTVGLILIASIGKFGGAFVGGAIGGLRRAECLALACGMNARGSTEVIVASIGLAMGALTQNLFTMIVTMAVVTTMAMPPMLRWALGRLPFDAAEKERLEREAFEEQGFVTKLERILLAVDDSANGKYASRLAGLVAGWRGLPITVLSLEPEGLRAGIKAATARSAEETVKAAAATAKTLDAAPEEEKPAPVEVTRRAPDAQPEEAVASEARKGYDLLLIGIDNTVAPQGGFHEEIERIAAAFEGPVAVLVSRGRRFDRWLEHPTDILAPISGTKVSRNAAEIALVLARMSDAALTALYVRSSGGRAGGRRGGGGEATATRRYEETMLKDIVELADRYRAPIRTALRVNMAAEDAILRQARRGRHDLIVMGVNRRPGPTLFFGNVAAAVLEQAECSVLFVST